MQVIYDDASNIKLTAQKRLVRVVYGQTQATPYAATLDPNLRNSETGAVEVPSASATKPVKRSVACASLRNSILPGVVLLKTEGEYVAPAAGIKYERPFGLLGQWVGGTFDNLKGTNQVSAWQGFDSVIDLLKPAFNVEHTGLKKTITALAGEEKTAQEAATAEALNVVFVADTNSLLSPVTEKYATEEHYTIVADLVELLNENVLRIKLRI